MKSELFAKILHEVAEVTELTEEEILSKKKTEELVAARSLIGSPLIISLPLSLIAAYLSGWFGMVLAAVNKIYERLWERLNRKK